MAVSPSNEQFLQTSKVSTRKKMKKAADSDTYDVIMETKTTRTRKTKGPVVLSPEDYPKRVESDWKVGAHVSASGGVENTILNAASIG